MEDLSALAALLAPVLDVFADAARAAGHRRVALLLPIAATLVRTFVASG